ncbi:DivIVA domain-containing protein [Actinomadura pelletieri DSM 43383]|uniref:Cell wall synthesis protein Wag31 n=1 Tax=Actinomadura pelletieri DSM 43383 TaxID=1120940 RepID=A0A495QQ25_9ACTN|nr:DivIVA domain-containing protein [Actinomadura pelletieri]RKS75029.1 DivIVA domain-containing protein [Actinomadura pelletieri DSM 43383]
MNSPDLPASSEGPRRLTPGELQSVAFARAALGRRGFDEEQVRNFLAYVEREFVQLLSERAALADEVNRLRAQGAQGAKGASNVMAPEDAHFQAVRILSQAQQTADMYVADAERYTRELSHEARLHREAILSDAKGRAEHILEDAHRKAAAVADTAVRTTEQTARPVPHQSGLPDTERHTLELEREVAYLRTYSDVYRTHLRSYLEALLRNVDEWEASERASLPR